jgi:AmmeMemoRadiSam system protein B/AmmeMemoRadiSam system protein A
MQTIRQPAMAGAFYPAQAQSLQEQVRGFLDEAARKLGPLGAAPKAIIVPHAGYVYSGAIAALAYASLAPARQTIRRVVLLGPVHRIPINGVALPGVEAFVSPLGPVAIDQKGVSAVSNLPHVHVSTLAHAHEHSLEVQLPFLQMALERFTLLPLVVGDATPEQVALVLEAVWGGDETLVVISSDLSHFLPYGSAQAVDNETVQKVLTLEPDLSHAQACGGIAVNGLLKLVRRYKLRPYLLGLCNSGDTAGDTDRVVGYASFAFADEGRTHRQAIKTTPTVNKSPVTLEVGSGHEQGSALPGIARAAIATALGQPAAQDETTPWLQQPGACFVTLMQNGQLRGCMGSLQAYRSLQEDVKANAVAAALRDARFAPLTVAELPGIEVEVSLLSPMQSLHFANEAQAMAQIRPGVDGVVFEFERYHSTFLPQVWEQLPTVEAFMTQLRLKAGLPGNFWANGVRLYRYNVKKWKESAVPMPNATVDLGVAP